MSYAQDVFPQQYLPTVFDNYQARVEVCKWDLTYITIHYLRVINDNAISFVSNKINLKLG